MRQEQRGQGLGCRSAEAAVLPAPLVSWIGIVKGLSEERGGFGLRKKMISAVWLSRNGRYLDLVLLRMNNIQRE